MLITLFSLVFVAAEAESSRDRETFFALSVESPGRFLEQLERRARALEVEAPEHCNAVPGTTELASALRRELEALPYPDRRRFPEQFLHAAGGPSASDRDVMADAWHLLASPYCSGRPIVQGITFRALGTEYGAAFHYAPSANDYAETLAGQWCGPFDDLRLFDGFIVVDRQGFAADYSLEVDPDSEDQNLVVRYELPAPAIFRLRYQPRRDRMVRFYASMERHHQVYRRCEHPREHPTGPSSALIE
ncbi:MAG: hypothetical protein AAGE01_00980 [Pseudomonadota bacterium]